MAFFGYFFQLQEKSDAQVRVEILELRVALSNVGLRDISFVDPQTSY